MSAETQTTEWVLVEELATKQRGRTVYFRDMTDFGPRCTENLDEAERFPTSYAATRSPAWIHALSFFEPRQVGQQ